VEPGKYVDIILPAEKLLEYFGANRFDIIISTETLEHIRDWRAAITNMKAVLKPGGYMYITTVPGGFPYHGYPYDFRRYDAEDMKGIFSDFDIIVLREDREILGTFLKARKPTQYKPKNLNDIALYSIIPDIKDMSMIRKLKFIGGENLLKLGRFIIHQMSC